METDAGDTRITALDEAVKVAPSTKPATETGSTGGSSSSSAKLEPFLLLAKSARGAAAAALVSQATAAPGVFVFSELLACPSIDELKQGPHKAAHDVLSLFAYGTWQHYTRNADQLGKLTNAQETKLKLLTILTLASINRMIPYSVLMHELALASVPALEDLLIEGFYSQVFTGRLAQHAQVVEITSGIGRDVRLSPSPPATAGSSTSDSTNSVASLLSTIAAFQQRVNLIVRSLDGHLARFAADATHNAKIEREHEARLRSMLDEVASTGAHAGSGPGVEGGKKEGTRRARTGPSSHSQSHGSVEETPQQQQSQQQRQGEEGMDVDYPGGTTRSSGSSSRGGGQRARKRGRT